MPTKEFSCLLVGETSQGRGSSEREWGIWTLNSLRQQEMGTEAGLRDCSAQSKKGTKTLRKIKTNRQEDRQKQTDKKKDKNKQTRRQIKTNRQEDR